MPRITDLAAGLYRGDVSFDFVGRRRLWYIVSTVLLAVSIGALAVNGLKFGVEFEGGSIFAVPSETCSIETARDATSAVLQSPVEPTVTEVSSASGRGLRVQTEALDPKQTTAVTQSLAEACGVVAGDVSNQIIGPTWGEQITKKALTGLVVFLIAVVIYLSIIFEWRMAIAALIALAHDVIITVGIYALVGFEVTPASVIGVLTILGYSLYDTVVVFDKVKENTKGLAGGSRMTYSEAANLAINQTLVRSINTSVVGLLPVAALLFVGAYILGAGTLKDLALALFVGIAVGTYSSIFVATPVVAQLKEREPAMQALAKRVAARRGSRGDSAPTGTKVATSEVTDADDSVPERVTAGAPSKAGPRNQPKRNKKRKRR